MSYSELLHKAAIRPFLLDRFYWKCALAWKKKVNVWI